MRVHVPAAAPVAAAFWGTVVLLELVLLGGCPGAASQPTAPTTQAPRVAPPSPPPPPPPTIEAPRGFGTIKGRVTVLSPKIAPPKVKVEKDPEVCGAMHDPGSLKIGADGGLEECIVFVKGPRAPADWDKTGRYVIDQKACHYVPRVTIIPVGAAVTFTSSDPVVHNVNADYKAFNKAISKGDSQQLPCNEPAFADLRCNFHGFMRGWLVVAENPWYALTDASGSFTLARVPAGTWKLMARHQDLGKQSATGVAVTVEPDKEVVVDLKYD